MKKNRIIIYIICICLAISGTVAAKTLNISMPDGMILKSQTNYTLETGVYETQIEADSTSGGSPVNGYIVNVSLSDNVRIIANYGSYYKNSSKSDRTISKWQTSRATSQASRYSEATGNKVLVATNGDYYNRANGKPLGALVLEGNVYHDASGRPYFAILKDGSPVIMDAGQPLTSNVAEAVGGSILLVKDGAVAPSVPVTDTKRSPCNSIGIKADGSIVIFLADGRDADESVGLTFAQQAQMLIGLGCVTAMGLDGGGSATYASRHKDSDALKIQNEPSDGKERKIASSLMVVALNSSDISTAKATATPKVSSAKATATPKASNARATTKPKTSVAKTTAKPKTSDAKATAKPKSSDTGAAASSNSSKSNQDTTQTRTGDSAAASSGAKQTSVTFKYGANRYRINSKKNKTVTFINTVKKNPSKVKIPDSIKRRNKSYKVTAIAAKACFNNKNLKTLVIGKNVIKIGKKAFSKCLSLKKVTGYKYVKCKSYKEFYSKYVSPN